MNIEKILTQIKEETNLEFDTEEFSDALNGLVESGSGDRIIWANNAQEPDNGEYTLVHSTNRMILVTKVVGTIDLDEEESEETL